MMVTELRKSRTDVTFPHWQQQQQKKKKLQLQMTMMRQDVMLFDQEKCDGRASWGVHALALVVLVLLLLLPFPPVVVARAQLSSLPQRKVWVSLVVPLRLPSLHCHEGAETRRGLKQQLLDEEERMLLNHERHACSVTLKRRKQHCC